MFW
jgi:TldD protein